MDGIDAETRNEANRKRLSNDTQSYNDKKMEYERTISELENIQKDRLLTDSEQEELQFAKQSLESINSKLTELEAISTSLNKSSDTQLLLYDPATGENGHELTHAAISIGNVDTANHVATYVPGMTTNVTDSMENITNDMLNMKDDAEAVNAGSVATIGWIGYDCFPHPLTNNDWSVVGTGEAEMGGQSLARFTEGIQDSRNDGDVGVSSVHQSVIAHSYGSTTASYGVEQV